MLAIETERGSDKGGNFGEGIGGENNQGGLGGLEMVMSLGVSCVRMRIKSVIVIGKVLLMMRRNSKREKAKI